MASLWGNDGWVQIFERHLNIPTEESTSGHKRSKYSVQLQKKYMKTKLHILMETKAIYHNILFSVAYDKQNIIKVFYLTKE